MTRGAGFEIMGRPRDPNKSCKGCGKHLMNRTKIGLCEECRWYGGDPTLEEIERRAAVERERHCREKRDETYDLEPTPPRVYRIGTSR